MNINNETRRRLNLRPESTLARDVTALARDVVLAYFSGVAIGLILGAVYLEAVGAW